MEQLFSSIFERRMSPKEIIILRRLRKLYGEDAVMEAIRLSAVVTDGSPIKYISVVANNLYKEATQINSSTIYDRTNERLEELKKYGFN
jgi:hypothetical protein